MRRVLFVGLVLLLAVGLFAGACGSGDTTAESSSETTAASAGKTAASTETSAASTAGTTDQATGEPIKIGHIVDLTDTNAVIGKLQQQSLELGLAGLGNQIAGRPVEIIIGDAQGQTAMAVDVARKLVENDKVVAVFGPNQVGQKLAVAAYMKQAGIPLILYSPCPPNIFQDNKWVIGAGGTNPQQPTCMADYVYNTLGYKNVVTLTQDNTAGHAFLDPFKAVFEEAGGSVAQQIWAPFPSRDFAAYLTSVNDADALVVWTAGSDAITMLNQYHELGLDKRIPIVGAFSGACFDPWVINALNPEAAAALVGTTAPTMYSPDSQNPLNREFAAEGTKLWGIPPSDATYSSPYQSALLFKTAVEATSGDTTPEVLLQALLSSRVNGPEGEFHFAAGDQAATKSFYIIRVEKDAASGRYQWVTVKTYSDVGPKGFAGRQ